MKFLISILISLSFWTHTSLALTWVSGVEEPAGGGAAFQQSQRFRSEDVSYRNGKLTLAAAMLIPQSAKRIPAVVILQGSGRSDRSNEWARAISETLVEKGVAVLLTDKRGSGKSQGNWQTADFMDLASDALAGVEYLRGRAEIDTARIGLVGLSQGGWIAPLAAARSEKVAFVINISGASVTYGEQTFTEMRNTARQAGLPETQIVEVLELNRAAAEYLTTGNWEQYARLRELGLRSNWRKIAAGFPGSQDLPIWTFLRSVVAYDPLPYWLQLTEPVLVVYGERDEQDNVPVKESVRRLNHAFESVGKRNYTIKVIPGAGHAFIDEERHALMRAFVDALGSWIDQSIVNKR